MSTKYQDKFGHPIERTKGKVRPFMASWIQDFIRHSPFCVMATSNENGDCDASPKGGTPGFVKVLNDKQVVYSRCRRQQTFSWVWQYRKQSKSRFDFLHSRAQFDGADQWQGEGRRSKRFNRPHARGLQSRRKSRSASGFARRSRGIL